MPWRNSDHWHIRHRPDTPLSDLTRLSKPETPRMPEYPALRGSSWIGWSWLLPCWRNRSGAPSFRRAGNRAGFIGSRRQFWPRWDCCSRRSCHSTPGHTAAASLQQTRATMDTATGSHPIIPLGRTPPAVRIVPPSDDRILDTISHAGADLSPSMNLSIRAGQAARSRGSPHRPAPYGSGGGR